MKIGFIADTNFLKKDNITLVEHTNYLNNINYFINYIEDLEKSNCDSKLIYFMPEVILEELYFQRITAFKKVYEKFEEDYKRLKHSIIGNIPINNIEDTALAEKEKYKSSSLLKILKLSTSKKMLDELIKDSLGKKAPLDRSVEGKKTDAGFKDALIWKTILYSEEINQCDKVYFFRVIKSLKNFKNY